MEKGALTQVYVAHSRMPGQKKQYVQVGSSESSAGLQWLSGQALEACMDSSVLPP